VRPFGVAELGVRPIIMISDSKALRIISILFLLGAFSSIVELCASFTQSRLFIPWGILGFWIYTGLLSYRPIWRSIAIVLLLIPIIFIPAISVIAVISKVPTYIEIIGFRIAQVPLILFLGWGIAVWLLAFWQFRVLMRPSVYQAFHPAKIGLTRRCS
jgi:hypothetical protein